LHEVAEDAEWLREANLGEAAAAADDGRYLDAGCSIALNVMQHPCARVVQRCHCAGGLVIAVDGGCALLGHPGLRQYDQEAMADVRLTLEELHAIREEAMADDLPIDYARMCVWSAVQARAYFEDGVTPSTATAAIATAATGTAGRGSHPQSPLCLPYLISTRRGSPGSQDSDGWRCLRGAVLRSRRSDHARHGFSALGLPAGSLVTVLTASGYAVRSCLGSASLTKVCSRRVEEAYARREERFTRRRVEEERLRPLRTMGDELRTKPMPSQQAQERETCEAARAAGRKDFQGVWRGHCLQCNGCSCYAKPIGLGRASRHWQYCAVCGCLAEKHEERGVVDRA